MENGHGGQCPCFGCAQGRAEVAAAFGRPPTAVTEVEFQYASGLIEGLRRALMRVDVAREVLARRGEPTTLLDAVLSDVRAEMERVQALKASL